MTAPDYGQWAVDLTSDLVAVDSVNPGLVPGSPGEARAAELMADRLDAAGFAITLVEPHDHPGRTSVVAVRDFGAGPTVVLNGHLDTVGVEGMEDPFTARIVDERMYGRGTCDMKAGVAGMVVAAQMLAREGCSAGRLVLALVADEEDASIGTMAVIPKLVELGIRADVSIVGEPTWLDLAVAHRGFAVMRATLTGRAAHTSRPWDGIDAVAALGHVIMGVQQADAALRAAPAHALLDHASTTVSVVSAGSAPFTIAAAAEAIVEKRTLPGEPPELALTELEAVLDAVRAVSPGVLVACEMLMARSAWQADQDGAAADVMGLLREASSDLGLGSPRDVGAPYWMESALWQDAGVPAVIYGPAGGALHAIDEWVDLPQVSAYPQVLAKAVAGFLTG